MNHHIRFNFDPFCNELTTCGSGPFWGRWINFSEHEQEDNPRNVAQVPQLSPTLFPLSHLQDLAQDHQLVELSQQCFMNVEWTELALAMVMGTLFLRCVVVLHVVL